MGSMGWRIDGRQAVPERERGVVIGIDVSKRAMTYGAFRPEGRTKVLGAKQDAAGFRQLAGLVERLEGEGYGAWLAYEPTGPYSTCLREWLLSEGRRVVQVNPFHVKRTKEVRDHSPDKHDGKDPGVIADLVWQGCYQEVRPVKGIYAELRAASVEWASLRKRRTALRNEALGLVEVWFPELGKYLADALNQSGRAILRRYGSTEEIVSGGRRRLAGVLRKASRNLLTGRAPAIWEAARDSVAPKGGQAARHRHLAFLLELLEAVEQRQAQLRGELKARLASLPEAQFLLSAPGTGTITVAGLLGECGDLGAYPSLGSLEKHVGLNLFEISSGQRRGRRHLSRRGRSQARYLLCQLAGPQMKKGGLYREFAQGLRAKGKTGREILVAVARKLLRLLYALARTRTGYDPVRFFSGERARDGLANLSGAPLAA